MSETPTDKPTCLPDCPTWEGGHRPGCPNEQSLEAVCDERDALRAELVDTVGQREEAVYQLGKARAELSEAKAEIRNLRGAAEAGIEEERNAAILRTQLAAERAKGRANG